MELNPKTWSNSHPNIRAAFVKRTNLITLIPYMQVSVGISAQGGDTQVKITAIFPNVQSMVEINEYIHYDCPDFCEYVDTAAIEANVALT